MARQAGHCNKEERLYVEDSILLFKKDSLCLGRQDIASGMRGYRFRTEFCCLKKIHFGKVDRTQH